MIAFLLHECDVTLLELSSGTALLNMETGPYQSSLMGLNSFVQVLWWPILTLVMLYHVWYTTALIELPKFLFFCHMYESTGYYTVNNEFNVSICNLSKRQINARRVCKSQGGLTANVKLHFFELWYWCTPFWCVNQWIGTITRHLKRILSLSWLWNFVISLWNLVIEILWQPCWFTRISGIVSGVMSIDVDRLVQVILYFVTYFAALEPLNVLNVNINVFY